MDDDGGEWLQRVVVAVVVTPSLRSLSWDDKDSRHIMIEIEFEFNAFYV